MKLKSFFATASAIITFLSMSINVIPEAVSSEQQSFTLSYNYSGDGITVEDEEQLVSAQIESGTSITLPETEPECDSSYFTGWTYDNVYIYEAGDIFKMPDHDVTLDAVWVDRADSDFHKVKYSVIIDGEEVTSKNLTDRNVLKGQPVSISMEAFMRDGYTQIGWTDGTNYFKSSDKMLMPDHDVVLEPKWFKYYNVVYDAGDVDRINGNTSFTFSKYETMSFDLADSSRLSRSGFTLSGWLCDVDGLIYTPISIYTMPSSDVRFTAVWTPKSYTVVFKSNNGKSETIKIKGETDSIITAPECTFTNSGYEFAGWNYNGTIYQAGDDFQILGALPGVGISLDAVWTKKSSERFDSISMAQARKDYVDSKITDDKLIQDADFILGK